jgi:hypothetical protein
VRRDKLLLFLLRLILDLDMATPAREASQTAGKADMKKAIVDTAQKGKLSQKDKSSQKVNAKDTKAPAPNKPSPAQQQQQQPKHKAVRLQTPAAAKADIPSVAVDEADSFHCTIAETSFDKPEKIHFTATTGPPRNPTYFISERRTYRQRVRKQIAEAEKRDKLHYPKLGTEKAPYLPSTQFPQKGIRLPPNYWNTRFCGHPHWYRRDQTPVTYFEWRQTNVAWEDELAKVPFGERRRRGWYEDREWYRSRYFGPVEKPVWAWEYDFMEEEGELADRLAGIEAGIVEAAHENENDKVLCRPKAANRISYAYINPRRTYYQRLEQKIKEAEELDKECQPREPRTLPGDYWVSTYAG